MRTRKCNICGRQYSFNQEDMYKWNVNRCPFCGSENVSDIIINQYQNTQPQYNNQVYTNIDPNVYLQRASIAINNGDFINANNYIENYLNYNPQNGEAYLYKLMVELRARNINDLKNYSEPFDHLYSYQNAYRFGDENLRNELESCITSIKKRKQEALKYANYNEVVKELISAKTKEAFNICAYKFEQFGDYLNSKELALDARNKAKLKEEEDKLERQNSIYLKAINLSKSKKIEDINRAINLFSNIPDYKDSKTKADELESKYESLKAKQEKRKKALPFVLGGTALIIVSVVLFVVFGIPEIKLNKATNLLEAKQYEEAIEILEELDTKKADDLLVEAEYQYGEYLYSQGQFMKAYGHYLKVYNYKDARERMEELGKYDEYLKYYYCEIGDEITFGTLEQDGDYSSDQDPITWIVLDKKDGHVLLMSKDIIGFYRSISLNFEMNFAFGKVLYPYTKENWSYSLSPARKYLNETFINQAFNGDQLKHISSEIRDKNIPTHEDKVFILSAKEIQRYLVTAEERQSQVSKQVSIEMDEAYKVYNDSSYASYFDNNGYWLRADDSEIQPFVDKDGNIYEEAPYLSNEYEKGLRPCIWIKVY